MSSSEGSRSCGNRTKSFLSALMRRKHVDDDRVTETKLARCLSTLDLTALGVGSTLGAGVYVVAGEVAKKTAGPAVIISFLIAASASVLAGLCYAEFGARVPKTGSAYVYSYVSVGELMAFVIGWNLILEYVIGTASVARAWSANFDEMIKNVISEFFLENMGMNVVGLATYPDFFAFAITLVLTGVLAIGVKESATFTKIFTGINLLVVSYVVICGLFKVSFGNWAIDPEVAMAGNWTPPTFVVPAENLTLPTAEQVGVGGFAPFGFHGIVSGAGTCFYAFVGFDAIATTGEEVMNPQKAIPISITICLLICFIAYFLLSGVVTLMCPYYLLDAAAPLPQIFSLVGWNVARYVIAVGAVCALSTSLLGAMFPLPRVIYAMASDGLIFRFLARVNQRAKTPLIATILSGVFAGAMACIFDLKELVDMMSIGTLLAYTLVAVSVLILRGNEAAVGVVKATETETKPPEEAETKDGTLSDGVAGSSAPLTKLKLSDIKEDDDDTLHKESNSAKQNGITKTSNSSSSAFEEMTLRLYVRHSFVKHSEIPSSVTEFINKTNTLLFFIFISLFCLMLVQDGQLHRPHIIFFLVVFFILSAACAVSLHIQPENPSKISFKVPAVPWIPCISMFVNVYLMMKLPVGTWYRFAIWMFAGFLIYFLYGLRHSSERRCYRRRQEEAEEKMLEAAELEEKEKEREKEKESENENLKEGIA